MGELIQFPAGRVRQNTSGNITEALGRQPVPSFDLVRKNHQLSARFDAALGRLAEANRKIAACIRFGELLIEHQAHQSVLSSPSQQCDGDEKKCPEDRTPRLP